MSQLIFKCICSICQEAHQIHIYQNDIDFTLTFEAKAQPFSLKQRLGHLIKLLFQRQSFITGNNRNFFGVILEREQLIELHDKLVERHYTHYGVCEPITKTYNVKFKGKFHTETIIEYFEQDGIRLLYDVYITEVHLSVHYMPKKPILAFTKGAITNELNMFHSSRFLTALAKCIGDRNADLQSLHKGS